MPNNHGKFTFSSSEYIRLECPGGKLTQTGNPTAFAKCNREKHFLIENVPVEFRDLSCNVSPVTFAKFSGKPCMETKKEILIGFNLGDEIFLTQLEICFDENLQNSLYSKFILSSSIRSFQCCPRSNFTEDKFYQLEGHSLNELYIRHNQRQSINRLLGLSPSNTMYIQNGNDYFLSRGHLTAKADFIYIPQQEMTFYLVNIAPQWQTFNGGNWNTLEQNCRDVANKKGVNLIIYTGTHEIATLPHAISAQHEPLYLFNENDRVGIPVPKFFWKVVYDPASKLATAFLGLNNPYHEISSNDVICEDVCNQISWISMKRSNNRLGFMYCCEIENFRKNVEFPEFPVLGLLS